MADRHRLFGYFPSYAEIFFILTMAVSVHLVAVSENGHFAGKVKHRSSKVSVLATALSWRQVIQADMGEERHE